MNQENLNKMLSGLSKEELLEVAEASFDKILEQSRNELKNLDNEYNENGFNAEFCGKVAASFSGAMAVLSGMVDLKKNAALRTKEFDDLQKNATTAGDKELDDLREYTEGLHYFLTDEDNHIA